MSNEDSLLNKRRILTDEQKERLKKSIGEESTPEAMEANREMARKYFEEHDKRKQFAPSVREYLTWLLRIHVAKEAGEVDTLRVEEVRDHLAKLRDDFAPDGPAIMFEVNRFVNCIRIERKEHNRPPATFREWIDSIADKIHRDYEMLRIAKPQDQQESDMIVGKMIALADVHSLIKHVIDTEPTSLPCIVKPPEPGRYLLASFEWWGRKSDRQLAPRWEIRLWNGVSWEHPREYPAQIHDEIQCDRFEPVRWQRLPPV